MQVESLETSGGNWRAVRRRLEEKKLAELLQDREACCTITLHGQRYRLSSMTLDELRDLAREHSVRAVQRVIAKDARGA